MSTAHATKRPNTATPIQTIEVAYTPDSDDAFNFYGWEKGFVSLPGVKAKFKRGHIAELNNAAMNGQYDVVAVSSVFFPYLADRYWILSVGSSVGRGYGPILVAKSPITISSLSGRRVAIAGLNTTGGTLARMYCPAGTTFVQLPYDTIADSILRGEVDAGVMIHEELIHYPKLGLHRVEDLGAAWTRDTGLPLPVGLNIAKKSLGRERAGEIACACRKSLQWSMHHSPDAMQYVGSLGRGCADKFVPMFCNTDTLELPQDVRRAMRLLFDRLAERGWAPRLENIEVIDA